MKQKKNKKRIKEIKEEENTASCKGKKMHPNLKSPYHSTLTSIYDACSSCWQFANTSSIAQFGSHYRHAMRETAHANAIPTEGKMKRNEKKKGKIKKYNKMKLKKKKRKY